MADAENTEAVSARSSSAPPARPSVAEAVTELVQTSVDYIRQETADVMHDKVVVPAQNLGGNLAFALAAAFSLMLGIGFLSAALLVFLGPLMGWPLTLLAVGGVLVLGAAVFTYLKVRSTQ